MNKVEQMLEDSARTGSGKVDYGYTPGGELTVITPEALARIAKDHGYVPPKDRAYVASLYAVPIAKIDREQAEKLYSRVLTQSEALRKLGIHIIRPKLQLQCGALAEHAELLAWLQFKHVASDSTTLVLKNSWYSIEIREGYVLVRKTAGTDSKKIMRFVIPLYKANCNFTEIVDYLINQVDYGTHYLYVAGIAIAPIQRFSKIRTAGDATRLALDLQEVNAQLAFYSNKVFRWVSKAGEVEITQSKLASTMAIPATTNEEEIPMNIFDLVAANELFETKVVFSGSAQQYSYKSDVAYEPGAKVVVDSPSTGFTVVTVVSSEKGLSGGNFPKYKWIVGAIDMARYDELMANEANAIAKLAAFQRAAKAKQELEALGLSAADVLNMLGLASKAE